MASDVRFKLELHVMLEVNRPESTRFQMAWAFNATSMQQKSGPHVATRTFGLEPVGSRFDLLGQ
jgi:hypothetical protein